MLPFLVEYLFNFTSNHNRREPRLFRPAVEYLFNFTSNHNAKGKRPYPT